VNAALIALERCGETFPRLRRCARADSVWERSNIRREQLVLRGDLRPVARERQDDVGVDDELAYAGTASFSISGAYIPVRAALFIFARW
jgi:hypothetical protein